MMATHKGSITLHMPQGGEAGVIVAIRSDGVRVEFRGRPYSMWDIGESTPMYQLHAKLKRINISELHNSQPQVVTPWHEEWDDVLAMFNAAISHHR